MISLMPVLCAPRAETQRGCHPEADPDGSGLRIRESEDSKPGGWRPSPAHWHPDPPQSPACEPGPAPPPLAGAQIGRRVRTAPRPPCRRPQPSARDASRGFEVAAWRTPAAAARHASASAGSPGGRRRRRGSRGALAALRGARGSAPASERGGDSRPPVASKCRRRDRGPGGAARLLTNRPASAGVRAGWERGLSRRRVVVLERSHLERSARGAAGKRRGALAAGPRRRVTLCGWPPVCAGSGTLLAGSPSEEWDSLLTCARGMAEMSKRMDILRTTVTGLGVLEKAEQSCSHVVALGTAVSCFGNNDLELITEGVTRKGKYVTSNAKHDGGTSPPLASR